MEGTLRGGRCWSGKEGWGGGGRCGGGKGGGLEVKDERVGNRQRVFNVFVIHVLYLWLCRAHDERR